MAKPNEQQWTTVVKPRTGWFDIDLKNSGITGIW